MSDKIWYCRGTYMRWEDDHFPGFIECRFRDRFDHEWTIIEKVPVITTRNLNRDSQYPQPAFIPCTIVSLGKDESDRPTAQISTEQPYGIASTDGVAVFEVFVSQLLETGDLIDVISE